MKMSRESVLKVYLAGPWVFWREEETARFQREARTLLDEIGGGAMTPVFPSDPIADRHRAGALINMDVSSPEKIAAHCRRHIHTCDALLADITPFRGVQPDPGTVFEIGLAHGCGKMIVLYTRGPVPALRTRLVRAGLAAEGKGDGRDFDGALIEDFGSPADTMLSPYPLFDNLEAAVRHLAG